MKGQSLVDGFYNRHMDRNVFYREHDCSAPRTKCASMVFRLARIFAGPRAAIDFDFAI